MAAAGVMMMTAGTAAAIPRSQQVPNGEPRYAVSVVSFRALDESGYDWSGSDEVFGIFASTRGHPTATSVHGDVDSGDLVDFTALERCLAPQRIISGQVPAGGTLVAPDDTWECDSRGASAPIGLNLELWEDDGCPKVFPYSCFDGYAGGIIDSADDLIGRVERTYGTRNLARLDDVGDSMNVGFILGGPCGHQEPGGAVCGYGPLSSTGPEYELRVVIQRVSDAPLRSSE